MPEQCDRLIEGSRLFIPAYRVKSGVLKQCDRVIGGSRLIHSSLQ